MIKAARAARKFFQANSIVFFENRQFSPKLIAPPFFYQMIKAARAARKCFQNVTQVSYGWLKKNGARSAEIVSSFEYFCVIFLNFAQNL